MAISNRLKGFLHDKKVRYTVTKHPVVYTAQEIAAAQHVPGRQLAKCVLLLSDRGPVLAVLPAVYLVDLLKLKRLLKAKSLSIGREADIKSRFPDVEVGAMSPFGNLYDVPVIVDKTLSTMREIVFNAGSHTETVSLAYRDFEKLVRPKVDLFGKPISGQAASRRPAARKPVKKRPTAKRSKKPAPRTAASRTKKRK